MTCHTRPDETPAPLPVPMPVAPPPEAGGAAARQAEIAKAWVALLGRWID